MADLFQSKPSNARIPCVKEAFDIADREGVPLRSVAYASGLTEQSLTGWKHRFTAPRLDLFEAFLNAFGYELAIRRRSKS